MRRSALSFAAWVGAAFAVGFGFSACGAARDPVGSGSGGGSGSGTSTGGNSNGNGSSSSGGLGVGPTGSGSANTSSSGGNVACPPGLQCNVQCSAGQTTSISGVVYDPAGANPLYNVAVYVPAVPLVPLPKGVPTGGDACNCGALFKSGAVVSATTGVDGSFRLDNVPVGSNVPLVLQVGKWRKLLTIPVTQCMDNAQAKGTLKLPGTVAAGDTDDNMPDIAVSTGSADTLECLMQRIGLPPSEYVTGAGGTGHVHIFAGGATTNTGAGKAERPGWGAPASDTNLWNSVQNMMPYDILLLSCEGGETYKANPANLESYLNNGGRAFGSHFHYAWFSGPLTSNQAYSAPSDWGNNLATWTAGGGQSNQANGVIVQTLNGSTAPFAKGQALFQWLGMNGALGAAVGAPPNELPIQAPRYNAVVGAGNTPSQPWINDDTTKNTMYFSFDTPVNAPPGPDGGAPNYCGRAVLSDLHVAGSVLDPAGAGGQGGMASTCNQGPLSPQEMALEFMLFDLSSCVIPDTIAPPDGGIPTFN